MKIEMEVEINGNGNGNKPLQTAEIARHVNMRLVYQIL